MHVDQIGNSSSAATREAAPRRTVAWRRAFTLIELLIVMGIIVVLATLVLSTLTHARKQAQSIRCIYNLQQIGNAFNLYAMDNNNAFPVPQLPGQSWESMLQKYLGKTDVFRCPADAEIWQQVGSSYDWRSSSDPKASLSGKKRTDKLRGNAVLAYETLPGWHEIHKMNVVRLDGAAESVYEDAFAQDVLDPVVLSH